MDLTVVYECAVCSAASTAIVSDLTDPDSLVSEKNKQLLRDIAETKRKLGGIADPDPVATMQDELLASSAKDALRYATCPRCGKRNPAGVLERAQDRRQTRIIGTIASALTAVAIWFLPWLAFGVVAIAVGMTVLSFVMASRAKTMRGTLIASNVGFTLLFLAAAWFYPRAAALIPLVLAVRFAIYGPDEGRWERAKETIRFDTPYR